MKVSIIIPVLNESVAVGEMLPKLQWARESGHEVIVVDGGSDDDTVPQAEQYSDTVISSARGRAVQMNSGAHAANGDVLLFLHIDTVLPLNGIKELINSIERKNGLVAEAWGRFNVRLSGNQFMFRIIETMMNRRSRITSISTGDQGIFITKPLFGKVGGYPEIPLMEDVEISRRLKKITKPVCLSNVVVTSSRRWESAGIYRTVFLMWRLRLAYWLGANPSQLASRYSRK